LRHDAGVEDTDVTTRLSFSSIMSDHSDGQVYVHAMLRLPMSEAILHAEVTVETEEGDVLAMSREELREWMSRKLVSAFRSGMRPPG
jgi:fructose/tagatose bisphosphate aldolase